MMPFVNSLSFSFEKKGYDINFSLARGIGSAAYALTSLLMGYVIALYNSDVLPIFYIVVTLAFWAFIIRFKAPKVVSEEKEKEEKPQQLSVLQFVRKYGRVMVVVLGIVLVYFDHAIITNFFAQVIEHVGGSQKDMGNTLFLASIVEIPMMLLFSRLCKKIDGGYLLVIAAVFFTIKHIITYYADSVTMIYVAEALQIFAYALFIPSSVYYVSRLISHHDITKGQAMMTGAMALSSVFASLLGGILLDTIGADHMLLVGAIVSFIGTIIVFFSVQKVDS